MAEDMMSENIEKRHGKKGGTHSFDWLTSRHREYDGNIQRDNIVPKIRVKSEILADTSSAVEIINISLQEESPNPLNSKF